MEPRSARVVSVGRDAVRVALDGDDTLRVASVAKRLERLSLVLGDVVTVESLGDDRLVVVGRDERRSQVIRRTAGGRSKTMAANVDTLAVVAALARPPPHLAMIDEVLAFAEIHDLGAVVVLTKTDLVERAEAERLTSIYRGVASHAIALDVRSDDLGPVREALSGRRTLLLGQSGVGKSSLFGRLGGEAAVGDLSRFGRGRQTTSSGRLHRFADGFLIDSPGVGDFTIEGVGPRELADAFADLRPFTGACRFADCRHDREPECAVRDAVASGRIAATRFASYREIASRLEAETTLDGRRHL